jgi:NAD(P)-dependent dehydrogenase (short-subunit alcohol dehydrogenase family)
LAHSVWTGVGADSAGKAGVDAFMKTVGKEEKENGIAAHLFDPGNVASQGNPQAEKDPMEMTGAVADMYRSKELRFLHLQINFSAPAS